MITMAEKNAIKTLVGKSEETTLKIQSEMREWY